MRETQVGAPVVRVELEIDGHEAPARVQQLSSGRVPVRLHAVRGASDDIRYALGGAGRDTFEIDNGAKNDIDTIADFKVGEDVIDLSGTAATKLSSLSFKGDGNGNTIVTVKSDGTKFKLVGYDPNDIDGSFFHF